jgi:LuxR family maltose regulon positive regulatory protein
VAARGIAIDYVRRLLAALERDRPRLPEETLAEPLTPREMEVLRLVAVGASNAQIAEQLVVAINTVKTHISRIHGKLAVSNRTEAVARARQLRMLK